MPLLPIHNKLSFDSLLPPLKIHLNLSRKEEEFVIAFNDLYLAYILASHDWPIQIIHWHIIESSLTIRAHTALLPPIDQIS